MICNSCWFIQVCVLFESLAECSLSFTYVCVAAVDVTLDVIDGSTLVFFTCSVFRVYYHRAEGVRRFVVHVYVMWLIIRPSCSDNLVTYGNPSRGLRGLLFVLGGLFGGGANAHSGYPLALRALWTCASSDFLSSAVVMHCCVLLVRVRTTWTFVV